MVVRDRSNDKNYNRARGGNWNKYMKWKLKGRVGFREME